MVLFSHRTIRSLLAWGGGVLLMSAGCETTGSSSSVSVEAAVGNRPPRQTASSTQATQQTAQPTPSNNSAALTGPSVKAIATVSGTAIPRERLVGLLIEGRGLAALEQLIVLEAAKQCARRMGIVVTSAHVQKEYEASLDQLLAESIGETSDEVRRQAGEAMLDDLLKRRGVARAEYMVVMERNAYLRRLAERDLDITRTMIEAEFDQSYGEKVEIRHIQVKSPDTLDQVLGERDKGAEFSELAVRFSANRPSAERLGLLPPFGINDPNVPELMRRAAFALEVGEVSEPIFVDGWYHILRLERRMSKQDVSLSSVRNEVEQNLRRKLTDTRMQTLTAELFREAEIEIADPMLRAAFMTRHRGEQRPDGP